MSRMYLPDPLITRSRWICKRLAKANTYTGGGLCGRPLCFHRNSHGFL